MPRFEDFVTLSGAIYGNPPLSNIMIDGPNGPQQWVFILESGPSGQSGYYGAAYLNSQTHEIVLVNRGTNDLTDVVSDAEILLDKPPDELSKAQVFYEQVKQEAITRGATLSITGHSLGGSLTELLVASHATEEINGSGVFGQTFNSLGVKGLLNDLGLPETGYAVTNWVTPTDVVGNLAEHIGDKQTLASLPFSFTYLAGPPGVLAFLYDSHQIAQVRDTFIADNSHPLLAKTREFLIDTYVTQPGYPVTIDGQVIVGGNNRINVGNELTGSAQNDLLFGGLPDDRIRGGAGSDVIYAGDGNDLIDGETGADIMLGENNDDTYVVDDPGDRVIEVALEGADTVESTVSYTLSANVENLFLIGNGAINATGNELNNILIGNNAANVLDGGLGTDSMAGGAGDDTYMVDNVGDIVNEAANEGTDSVQSALSYVLGSNVENLTLTGSGAINGSGNALDNVLIGNSAANELTGGSGNDLLQGGAGFDTYIYKAGDGNDTIEDSDGRGAILADGHLLTGGIHKDTDQLNTFTSLDGTFTFAWDGVAGHALTINNLLTVQDFQDGQFGIRLHDLPDYVNGLPDRVIGFDPSGLFGFNDQGNPFTIVGATNNIFHAFGGNDYVVSGIGNDQMHGDAGDDTLFGQGGDDRIFGGDDNDTLSGDEGAMVGNDVLDGGAGGDALYGGAGDDVLLGGTGADFLSADDFETPDLGGHDFLDGGDVLQLERMAA